MSNELHQGEFFEYFEGMQDVRQEGKVCHKLTDILFIVISGIICGYDEWENIYIWAKAKSSQEWLKKYISLANGLPSLSTIKRVFALIDPEEFSSCFIDWMKGMLDLPEKDVIAVDGKTSKGSRSESKHQNALHMVSALCHSQGLVIGQTKTDDKSNEITAIPKLLDQLLIEGCIITIDAMGAQKKIAKKIVDEKKADYVISLKGNQGTLQNEVKDYFEDEWNNIQSSPENKIKVNENLATYQTVEKGHGRVEKRTYYYSTDIDWMVDAKRDWEKLTGIGKVVREVEYIADSTKRTTETAYYIGSVNNVNDFATAVRYHWSVESMHWSLDVTFGDDRNQTKEAVAAQNLTMAKRLVFNLLKNEKTYQPKMSKPNKRVMAATDPEYRDILINSI